mmetsp:Transcript_21538/g.61386  ORF Transcript_21538/g.61386 Transcript_21538/m.61386 type:complete len:338 (-) Transcript_21538:16-1029(-)
MDAADCRQLRNPCECFAANNGESCAFCFGTRRCLPMLEAFAECGDTEEPARSRRNRATQCGADPISNLASEPASIVPGSILPAYRGTELDIELGAVFNVAKISARVVEGAVRLNLEPESHLRDQEALDRPCNASSTPCEWVLAVPFVKRLTFVTAEADEDFALKDVKVPLESFEPVDGALAFTSEWSMCNVGCGIGEQERNVSCSPPRFGGLPCYGADGVVVLNSSSISRSCQATTDCGTNWGVMLIIGWWQLLLVALFIARKVYQYTVARRAAKQESEFARHRRFSSDFDINSGLDERLEPSYSVDEDGNASDGGEQSNDSNGRGETMRPYELKLA